MGEIFSTWDNSGADLPPTWPPTVGGAQIRAFMGWKGMIINDDRVDIVDLTRAFAVRTRGESCGQCFPCRMGTTLLAEILERICAGQGRASDLTRLPELARYIAENARCDIGRTSPKPILDALNHFPRKFAEAVHDQRPRPRGKYVSQLTAPCIAACPAHVDIPGYVEDIRSDRSDLALKRVRETCSLPGTVGRVCVHYCENVCRRA
ncbi:MAG: hypothetical protein JXR89_05640, partial [Deltaproteobacteria bacterium]|nr:hypothetical protein [Deltaproteobacteria bacterium]